MMTDVMMFQRPEASTLRYILTVKDRSTRRIYPCVRQTSANTTSKSEGCCCHLPAFAYLHPTRTRIHVLTLPGDKFSQIKFSL